MYNFDTENNNDYQKAQDIFAAPIDFGEIEMPELDFDEKENEDHEN